MYFKPKTAVTPSQRHLLRLNLYNLRKKPIVKNQLISLKNSAGRNNTGKITVRHNGGGHKKRYRKLNFFRTAESNGIVLSLEYDPYRNTNIVSVYDFLSNKFFYMIAPKDLQIGDIISAGSKAQSRIGHSLPVSEIPLGSYIHNVSFKVFDKAQISRSAGTSCYLKEKMTNYAKIRLSSGEEKLISLKCFATIGVVSNEYASLTKLGKAGRSRWLNKRPSVRGVAMNPVDHPHGGGEGKKSGSGKTPWGKHMKIGRCSSLINRS